MVIAAIAGAILTSESSLQEGVKGQHGWTYFGEKIIRQDRVLYHRKRTSYTQTSMIDKSSVPEDKSEGTVTVEAKLASSHLRVRHGFLGRSANGLWKLFDGPEWKGSKHIEQLTEKKIPSRLTLQVPGGFTGIIFRKTVDEEWRDTIKLGNRLETREIFDRNEELIKVLLPAGSQFNTQTGEIEPLKPKS